MTASRLLLVMLAASTLFLASPRAEDDTEQAKADEALLKKLDLKTDGPALMDFFRKRTLSKNDQAKLEAKIKLLGDDSFEVRETATEDLKAAGRSALPFLKAGLKDSDVEVRRRAEQCIAAIEDRAEDARIMAAARLLAAREPKEAPEILLNYLPFADEEYLTEELLNVLAATGTRDGKISAILVTALNNEKPICREAAALAVGQAKDGDERAKVRPLLTDKEPKVRFRAAQGLLAAKEKEAVPALIGLLIEGAYGQAAQAEEYLQRLAGDNAPKEWLSDGKDEQRKKCKEAWDKWWKDQGEKLDLAKFEMVPPSLGLTLVATYDNNQVFELTTDGKTKWKIDKDLLGPLDAQIIRGNRVLIVEHRGGRITERDFTGKVLWEHKTGGNPTACKRLPNGNTAIATINQIIEVTPEGKTVWTHNCGGAAYTFQALKNGHFMYVAEGRGLVELDEKGKQLKTIKVQMPHWSWFDVLPGDRYLCPMNNKLQEIDSAGKSVWECNVACQATCAVRLRNGNNLICARDQNLIQEVDPKGKVVWEQKVGGRPFRVSRR